MDDVLGPGGQRELIGEGRTATLATLSRSGRPRLVPICFVLADRERDDGPAVLYSPLDQKPKRGSDVRSLARVRDILERPDVTVLFDRWSEDWSRLTWVRARGIASILEPDEDVEAHRWAVDALRDKYPQYRDQAIETLPMIRIVIEDVTGWSAAGSGT